MVLLGSAAVVAAGAAVGIELASDDDKAEAAEPTIKAGEEACASCGMIIDDMRFAAAWIAPGGKESHFDDVGCLLEHRKDHEPKDGTRFFVHEYTGEAWLNAEQAHYAISTEIRSPMAYGAAAFADETGAKEAVTDEHLVVASWAELPSHLQSKGQGHE
jgi:copper chaperone NosL